MEDVVTIYFQGNNAPRTQACKYAGKAGLDVRTTKNEVEHVYNPDAPHLLHNLFLYNELNDIEYGCTWNPCHWLSGAVQKAGVWYYNVYGTSCTPHNKWSVLNLAGTEDVTQYVNAIKDCIRQHPEKKIVLFGTSRGAATLITTLSVLTTPQLSHIKLAIAEAPFATVESVLYDTWPSPMVPCILGLLEWYTQFRREQWSPLDAVRSASFPLQVPLLFVTSEIDKMVPVCNTMQLIDVLQSKEHPDLHHLKLQRSHHSTMSIDDAEDQEAYLNQVRRLYRKYL